MGTTSSFFGGGGGSSAPLPVYTFINSNTSWTPPYNGTAYVHVIGAGGNAKSGNGNKKGAGAGGYSMKLITLSTGTNCNITIGAQNANSQGTGGTSSFADGTDTLTAYGGTYSTGGTASGGTYNYQGGDGGNMLYSYSSNDFQQGGGGGGAVSLNGTRYAGGDAQLAFDSSSGSIAAGGAGIGGSGGKATANHSSLGQVTGSGGGSGGPGYTSNKTSSQEGCDVQGGPASVGKPAGIIGFDFIKEWGVGGSFQLITSSSYGEQSLWRGTPGVGGGGSGGRGREYNHSPGQDGGLFGGGGGGGGNGGLGGGGGGGFYRVTTDGARMFRGHGGAGVVFIEYVTLT